MQRKEMKMAMSVGNNNHCNITEIQGRHFIQTAKRAGLPDYIAKEDLEEISAVAENEMQRVEKSLPDDFPEEIHVSVMQGMKSRLHQAADCSFIKFHNIGK